MAYNTKIQLNLYKYENNAFKRVAVIDDYNEISFSRNFYEAGEFTVTINRNIPNAEKFEIGLFVQFGNDKYDIGEINSITNPIASEGKGSQNITISGYDLRYLFKRRVIKNRNANGKWEMTAKGEIVMRSLIADQCGENIEAKRRLPIVNVIPNSADAIGKQFSISESFTNLYDVLTTIATQSEIGWRIKFENGTMTLECYPGSNLSDSVFFSTEFDSLQDGEFNETTNSFSNAIYIGGKGQGDERDIYEGEDGSPEGLERFESWDDQSSLTDESEYENEATSMLAQYGDIVTVSGTALAKNPYIYKENYNVGDIIKISFSGKSANTRVLSVTEHWSGRGEYAIEFEFGKPMNNLDNQLQLMLRQIQRAGDNSSSTDSVRWYAIPQDTEMPKADVTFNTIGFIGDCGAGATFKLYFDENGTGSKSYHVWFKQLAGGKLTLTTGVAGKQNLEMDSGTYVAIIYVDQEGNVLNQASAVSVNSGGQSAGTASTITVNGKTYDVGGGGNSVSVGFIQPQYKKVNRAGWLYLDGSQFDENEYPALYLYLGTNVLPDYREFGLVGAEENTTDVYDATINPNGTIHNHDVYTEGQAKDDQFQGHSHNYTKPLYQNTSSGSNTPKSANSETSKTFNIVSDEVNGNPRYGTTTRGKRKAVYFYIKAIDGETIADENQFMGTVKNYLKTAESYSIEETLTGGTWIDGKPIYRKVIEITETLVSPSGGFTLGIPITETPNIERVLKSTLIGRRETSEQRFMMSGGDALVAPSTSKIMFHSTTDIYVSKVIVEYTKTTD